MEEILTIMNKGEDNLSEVEGNRLLLMALAAERFENLHYPFP